MAATNDRISRVLLRFEVDKAATAVVQQEIQRLKADMRGVTAEEEYAITVSHQLNNALGDLNRAAQIEELGTRFGNMARAVQLSEVAAGRLRDQLAAIGATGPEVERAAQAFATAQAAGVGGVGPSLQTQIRLAGSKLRALPSIQIPGAGIGTDAIANIIRLIGSLPPPLLAAGAAIGAVTAAIIIMNKQLDAQKKAYDAAIKSNQAYYDAIGSQTTTQDAVKRIKELQTQIAAEQAALENQQRAQSDAFKAAQHDLFGGDVTARLAFALGGIGTGAEESQKKIADLTAEMTGLQRAVDQGALADADAAKAAEAAAEAQAKLNEQLYKYAQDTIDVQIDTQKQLYDLYVSGSEKQLDQVIADTRQQINLTGTRLDKERALQTTYKAGSDQYDEVTQKIEDLNQHQKDLIESLNAYTDSAVRAAVQQNDLARQQDEIRANSAASFQKYQEEIAKIEADGAEKRADVEQKYQDKLADIAQNAAEKEADLLQKLGEKRVDLAQKYADNEADALTKLQADTLDRQIDYQREEAKAARDHARDIAKIQKDQQEREFDLILNRDFAGLFKSRRQTTQQIEESNQQYAQERADRLEAFQNENDDAQRHFLQQEAQRALQYQRELQAAQVQYNRELAAAEKNRRDALQKAYTGYQQELAMLSQKISQELTAKRQAELAELQLIAQGDAAKLEAERNYYAQAVAFIQSMASQIGQALTAGAQTVVAGGTPGGSGGAISSGGIGALFGGLKVGASSSVRSQSNTFNISGNNPARIADLVDARITQRFQEFFG